MGAKWPRVAKGGENACDGTHEQRILSKLMSLIITGYKIIPFAPGRGMTERVLVRS